MDKSNSSQKKIRKVLRNRRLSIVPIEVVKPKNCFEKRADNDAKMFESSTDFQPRTSSSLVKHDTIIDKINGKKPKIDKTKAKIKTRAVAAERDNDVILNRTVATDCEDFSVVNVSDTKSDLRKRSTERKVRNEKKTDQEVLDKQSERDEQGEQRGEQDEREEEDEQEENDDRCEEKLDEENEMDIEYGNVNCDTDTENFGNNCIMDILKGFNKDIGALYSQTGSIMGDIKELKRMMKDRPSHHCELRSLSSQFAENSAFSLIPKLPLKKRSHVRKMQSTADENEEYTQQFVNKLASFGGKSVPEVVINIFNKLFTNKLKTKYCWRGSSKGEGKKEFKKLTNVIDIIWRAVKVHFKNCTEATVIKEIKLRFNQAQKDLDREMGKGKK